MCNCHEEDKKKDKTNAINIQNWKKRRKLETIIYIYEETEKM